jgi:hypothetical protein
VATTLPTPATISANTNPTAANLNTYRDSAQQLQGLSPTGGQGPLDFFTAIQSSAQTGLGTGNNAITFSSADEVIDSASGHVGGATASKYTGQTPGYYEVSGVVAHAGSTSGTNRTSFVSLNGNPIGGSRNQTGPAGAAVAVCLPTPVVYVYMNGTTDYVELYGGADYASWATVASTSAACRLNVRWVHV